MSLTDLSSARMQERKHAHKLVPHQAIAGEQQLYCRLHVHAKYAAAVPRVSFFMLVGTA